MKVKDNQKLRFVIVGAINTLLDFGLFFSLSQMAIGTIAANYISTSAALGFSFFANQRYTFHAEKGNRRRQITLFLIVTLIGLWVLQPIVISIVTGFERQIGVQESVTLIIAKLLATLVSLTWNYILYSKIVFKKI